MNLSSNVPMFETAARSYSDRTVPPACLQSVHSMGDESATRTATPFVLINEHSLHSNVKRMAAYTASHKIALRPHAKTHKSLEIGRMQMSHGALGLTVAKVSEAEVFAKICQDLLLAYPVVDEGSAHRVAALAGDIDLKVAIDSVLGVQALAAAAAAAGTTIGILVDIDVGLGRTGVQSAEDAVELAVEVERSRNLALRGVFCYPGHVWNPPGEQTMPLAAVGDRLRETLDCWQKHGLAAEIVSAGSTPTAFQTHLVPEVNEIRPGTYVFNDMNTVRGGYAALEDCAAGIVTTVVSNAVPGQLVIDAGSKTLSSDRCLPAMESGYGYVVEFPDARITKLSEEHGQLDVTRCANPPRLGDQLTVIPNHICPCVNLQDTIWLRTAEGEVTSLAVDARGARTEPQP